MTEYKNPPNPYLVASIETWKEYTEAYHSGASTCVLNELYKAYEVAIKSYYNNPQTIFNES